MKTVNMLFKNKIVLIFLIKNIISRIVLFVVKIDPFHCLVTFIG